MRLRPIVPMELPETKRAQVTGEKPKLIWVPPSELLVDGTYQRDLTRGSVRLIRRIVSEFAWTRIKPPVVVKTIKGYHVIDGQHTAIAGASLGLKELPVFLVSAPEVLEQARAFVSHNTNRIAVGALSIHKALSAGGDPLARTIDKVCKEVGVQLCVVTKNVRAEVGDCASVSRVRHLFQVQGAKHAREVLTVLVNAKCAPISEAQLAAVSIMLQNGAKIGLLTNAIRVGEKDLLVAKAQASKDRCPTWKPLAGIWTRRINGNVRLVG